LVEELRAQLAYAKETVKHRENELNSSYALRWKQLTAELHTKMENYQRDVVDQMRTEHERTIKSLEKKNADLEEDLEKRKSEGIGEKVNKAKYEARLQNMEFELRKMEKAKEAAEDALISVRADLSERLNDAKYRLKTLKDQYDELQRQCIMLRQKIEVRPEVGNYEEIISEWENSWEMGRPPKKRKRESFLEFKERGMSLIRNTNSRDDTADRDEGAEPGSSTGGGNSSILRGVPSAGRQLKSFTISSYANHDNGGPWLEIMNTTSEEHNLEDWSLLIENESWPMPRTHLFDSYAVPPGQTVRVVTENTRPRQENDILWKENWEVTDEVEISLLDPNNQLAGGPIPIDKPTENKTQRNCHIM